MSAAREEAEASRRAAGAGPVPTVRCKVELHRVAGAAKAAKHLVAASGSVYELIRTLKPTLTGKVKYACRVTREGPSGAFVRDPSTTFAIKVYHKTCVETRTNIHHAKILEDPREEWRLWHHLSTPGHPNVARMVELLEDDAKIYCVMEYIEGGELFDRMASGPMSREQARRTAFGVVSAVRYMHQRGVCHRDLSLENFMLTKDGVVKVIDFGQAKPWVLSPFAPVTVGKKGTRAPEVYRRRPHDGRAVDMWAIGSVIFTILTTLPPYETVGDAFYNYLVRQGARNLLTHWDLVRTMDPEALDLVHRLLCVDVAKRLSAEDAFNSPWFAADRKEAAAAAAAAAERASFARAGGAGESKTPDKAGDEAMRTTMAAASASVPAPVPVAAPCAPRIVASPSMEGTGMDGVVVAGSRPVDSALDAAGCGGCGGGGSADGPCTPPASASVDMGASCTSVRSIVDLGASGSSVRSIVSSGGSVRSSAKMRSDSSVADYASVRSVSADSCGSLGESSASFADGASEAPSRQHSAEATCSTMDIDQPRPDSQPASTNNARHAQNPPVSKARAGREESCASLMSVGDQADAVKVSA